MLALARLLGIEPLSDGSLLLNMTRGGVDGITIDFPIIQGLSQHTIHTALTTSRTVAD
jgi:hypothetical protein